MDNILDIGPPEWLEYYPFEEYKKRRKRQQKSVKEWLKDRPKKTKG